jgi:hypothetical protein
MKQGVIVGGWEYVKMAYGLTFSVLVLYGILLVARLREARRREG